VAVRREVAERDGHACAFVGRDGHRCGATRGLQYDHVRPLAEGGETSAANLRLLCAAHNRHEADRILGADRVRRVRESRERERARERDAKRREREREAARRAGIASRANEVVAPLRLLGFTHAEAREGARLAESIAGQPLEVRIKLALAALARPVLERSERRARAAG
jgi:hypothetical protein